MNRRLVCDSSAVVALLIDDGPEGTWAAGALRGVDLLAPHLMPFEAANILRRHELSGLISRDVAVQAHADLCELTVELWPYDLLAARAWELRGDLSIYDAAYVTLAETVGAELATLDGGIERAPGIRCPVTSP